MRRIACLLFLAVISASALSCASTRSSPNRMKADAAAVDRRFLEAFNKGDLDGIMACYWKSPDVVMHPPDAMVAQGWSEVREGFQGMIRTMPGAKLTLQKSENRVEGDVVVGWGEWTLTLPSGGGGPATMQGRYLDIKGVRNGKWVYLYDHASVPIPEGS